MCVRENEAATATADVGTRTFNIVATMAILGITTLHRCDEYSTSLRYQIPLAAPQRSMEGSHINYTPHSSHQRRKFASFSRRNSLGNAFRCGERKKGFLYIETLTIIKEGRSRRPLGHEKRLKLKGRRLRVC